MFIPNDFKKSAYIHVCLFSYFYKTMKTSKLRNELLSRNLQGAVSFFIS